MVLAEDEAKIQLQANTQRVWAPQGETPQVRIDPRKDSACVYGTLNLRTGRELATLAITMDSDATIAHVQALLDAHPDQLMLLFWDRAPWHTSHKVQAFLQRHGRIGVIWFPPGSPDVNPQEHVWKAVRAAIEHNHAYADLASLVAAFLHELQTRHFASSFFVKYGGAAVCPILD